MTATSSMTVRSKIRITLKIIYKIATGAGRYQHLCYNCNITYVLYDVKRRNHIFAKIFYLRMTGISVVSRSSRWER